MPEEFVDLVLSSGLLGRANLHLSTMFEVFEQDEVERPEVLAFLAGGLSQIFRGHGLEPEVSDLVDFLLVEAATNRCVMVHL